MLKILYFVKNILFILPVTLLLAPFGKLMHFLVYYNRMLLWVYRNKKHCLYTDFFTISRKYGRRYKLYEFVANQFGLGEKKVAYLEFGVADGDSFRWWLNKNTNEDSRFWGFDTFEGLPEKWGPFFKKGDMHSEIPEGSDKRQAFLKGLFQDTLPEFLVENRELLKSDCQRVIHMDADLYSSTLFTLSQLYPFIKKGDIILFDEFNVPLHEFKAFKEFTESFYIKMKPIASVNNFYQTVFVVE